MEYFVRLSECLLQVPPIWNLKLRFPMHFRGLLNKFKYVFFDACHQGDTVVSIFANNNIGQMSLALSRAIQRQLYKIKS